MPTTMKLIAKQTLGSDAASVTFSDIPGTYTDLLVYISTRSTKTSPGNWADVRIRPNSASTNLSMRMMYGDGSSAASASYTDYAYFWAPSTSSTSSTFGNAYICFPNYAGSTNKSLSMESVTEHNGTSALIVAGAGLWSSTAAITSLMIEQSGGNLVSGSTFYCYGITKA